jgi:uncharacterized membrane protein
MNQEAEMSYQKPVGFLVAVFQGEQSAQNALETLKDSKEKSSIQEAAVLRKDSQGAISINEPKDWGMGRGAALGGVIGALAGLVIGPGAVLTSAAGAAVGGLAAKMYDTGFDNQDLKALTESLEPGTSALLLAAEGQEMTGLREQLQQAGAQVVTDALKPEVAEQMSTEFGDFLGKLKEVGADGLMAEKPKDINDRAQTGRDAFEHRDLGAFKPGT